MDKRLSHASRGIGESTHGDSRAHVVGERTLFVHDGDICRILDEAKRSES
jgi:hypothetical protein